MERWERYYGILTVWKPGNSEIQRLRESVEMLLPVAVWPLEASVNSGSLWPEAQQLVTRPDLAGVSMKWENLHVELIIGIRRSFTRV